MTEAFRNILVIAGSGIGNILVATPLIRSLRRANPDSRIDVLVPRGRGGILEGNPDVHEVIEVVRKQGMAAATQFVRRIWRRYDVAFSAQAGDRSIIHAWLAGRVRYSHIQDNRKPRLWYRVLLNGWVASDSRTHVVIHGLRLLDTTEIPKIRDLVPPDCAAADENSLGQLLPLAGVQNAYAVIHLYPRNLYKAWTPEGWKSVIQHLVSRGMAVVVTGGHGPDEQKHLRDVLEGDSSDQVVNLAGQLSLPQVSALLGGASLYVGPDTGITHLAAAHGIPTVALFGPTDPVYWGPWPFGYTDERSPYARGGSQRVNNVYVVQRDAECVGCGKEGCEDDPRLPSRCMQELPDRTVVNAIDEMLKDRASRTATGARSLK